MTDKGTVAGLPKRPSRLDDETIAEIVRLDTRQVAAAEIARRLGVTRRTVARTLERMRATIAVSQDLSGERARALAVYLELQRVAWQDVEERQENGGSVVALLAEIRQAQTRIDQLLGLAVAEPGAGTSDDFVQIVLDVIRMEAPDLAPRIGQRLLERKEAMRG